METQSSIVYLYGFSLRQRDKLETLLKILREQVESKIEINVVMIHDGVIGTTLKEKIPELLKELLDLSINIYAIIPDLKARGMDPKDIIDKIKGLDYNGLVDLLVHNEKIVSWM
ncbi:MAG: sulfurtransferase complex subunit TusB [Promethearchaeota archaeon]